MSDFGYIVLCLVGLLGYAALLRRVVQRRAPARAAVVAPVCRLTPRGGRRRR